MTPAALAVEYRHNQALQAETVASLFRASGIDRPADDLERLERMFAEANLVISAWLDGELVGVCRALTDHSYCCYVSDLAVDKACQGRGIGKRLLAELRSVLDDAVTVVLVSAPAAVSFYPPLGFVPAESAFIIRRKR